MTTKEPTRCAYDGCGQPAVGLFSMMPSHRVRPFCGPCRRRVESTGLSLTLVLDDRRARQ